MNYTVFSYRFAKEILEHKKYKPILKELYSAISDCPIFVFPNKTKKNPRLDVVQQLLNAFFDIRLAVQKNWLFLPLATDIQNSKLEADFRKEYNGLNIQVEVQFGNMARWYADIFKFQTAYSTKLADIGVCIVPKNELGVRIGDNITNYERCLRELNSADMSITIPILIIGINDSTTTTSYDISNTMFNSVKSLRKKNSYRIVNEILNGSTLSNISSKSPVGNIPQKS